MYEKVQMIKLLPLPRPRVPFSTQEKNNRPLLTRHFTFSAFSFEFLTAWSVFAFIIKCPMCKMLIHPCYLERLIGNCTIIPIG